MKSISRQVYSPDFGEGVTDGVEVDDCVGVTLILGVAVEVGSWVEVGVTTPLEV